MEQRRWGIVLIAVVLLGIFVTSNLRDRELDRIAVAEQVPGPPAVGDCAAAPFVLDARQSVASDTVEPEFPVVELGPCDGSSRYGEVVSVTDRPVDSAAGQSEQFDGCGQTARSYLGLPAFPEGLDEQDPFWMPGVITAVALSEPSERQQIVGQNWLACVVYAPDLMNAGAGTTVEFDGPVRDILSSGATPDAFGVCSGPSGRWGSCREPHHSQLLASGSSGRKVSDRVDLEQQCRELAGELTGMPDVTDGGRLAVRLTVSNQNGDRLTYPVVPPTSGLECHLVAVGERVLAGGLIGLGGRPVPWA